MPLWMARDGEGWNRLPFNMMLPCHGISPNSALASSVLPLPESPATASISPSGTVKLTSLKAVP